MSKLGLSTGTTPNDGTGDSLLQGALKINSNFNEIYSAFGDGADLKNLWISTEVGIHTLSNVGVATTNPKTSLQVGTAISMYGSTGIVSATAFYGDGSNLTNLPSVGGSGDSYWISTAAGIHTLSNVGIGITNPTSSLTVEGNTSLETLNVSGVSTFLGQINPSSSGILFDSNTYTGSDTPIQLWVGNSGGSRYFTLGRSNGGQVRFDNDYPTGSNDHIAPTHSFTQTGTEYYALFNNGSVKLYHPASSSGILDQKFETVGYGVSISGDITATGIVTASSFSGPNTLKERVEVSGVTTSIENNGIGNTNITGFKSYALLKVGLSTAGWLRLYTDDTSRTNDESRSIGIDPTPGSGVIAEVVTTGISTTQIVSPFVIGGNLDNPVSTTIYASIKNLSGTTQSITATLTILKLEA
jgi:hypothetical protein